MGSPSSSTIASLVTEHIEQIVIKSQNSNSFLIFKRYGDDFHKP